MILRNGSVSWKTVLKITAAEQKKKEKRIKRNAHNIKDLWGKVKCNHIHIQGFQKEKRERKGLRMYVKT